jgi:hypothetical protein
MWSLKTREQAAAACLGWGWGLGAESGGLGLRAEGLIPGGIRQPRRPQAWRWAVAAQGGGCGSCGRGFRLNSSCEFALAQRLFFRFGWPIHGR